MNQTNQRQLLEELAQLETAIITEPAAGNRANGMHLRRLVQVVRELLLASTPVLPGAANAAKKIMPSRMPREGWAYSASEDVHYLQADIFLINVFENGPKTGFYWSISIDNGSTVIDHNVRKPTVGLDATKIIAENALALVLQKAAWLGLGLKLPDMP